MKPLHHDSEVFGENDIEPVASPNTQGAIINVVENDITGLLHSAKEYLSNSNPKQAVDCIALAHDRLMEHNIHLQRLRNSTYKSLSACNGHQASPHPEALRLLRLTPTIKLSR